MPHRRAPQPERPPRPDRRPVLSVCTILILSGFVLGMSLSTQMSDEMRAMVSLAGLTGLVAFLGLDHVSIRRRRNSERQEQEYMENRLFKHVVSVDNATASHEELLSLAREATSAMELDELLPAESRP